MEAMLKEISWFDAVLMVVWAGIGVLGAKRGLGGLVWVLAALLIWPLITTLSAKTAVLALPLSALLGWGAALLPRYLIQLRITELWHTIVGGLAGTALGAIMVLTLALSFPIRGGYYPSTTLPRELYTAVSHSFVVKKAIPLWGAKFSLLHSYIAPDRIERK